LAAAETGEGDLPPPHRTRGYDQPGARCRCQSRGGETAAGLGLSVSLQSTPPHNYLSARRHPTCDSRLLLLLLLLFRYLWSNTSSPPTTTSPLPPLLQGIRNMLATDLGYEDEDEFEDALKCSFKVGLADLQLFCHFSLSREGRWR